VIAGQSHLDRLRVWVIQAAEKALFRNGSVTGHNFSRAAQASKYESPLAAAEVQMAENKYRRG
jgi:hypothetical protein